MVVVVVSKVVCRNSQLWYLPSTGHYIYWSFVFEEGMRRGAGRGRGGGGGAGTGGVFILFYLYYYRYFAVV